MEVRSAEVSFVLEDVLKGLPAELAAIVGGDSSEVVAKGSNGAPGPSVPIPALADLLAELPDISADVIGVATPSGNARGRRRKEEKPKEDLYRLEPTCWPRLDNGRFRSGSSFVGVAQRKLGKAQERETVLVDKLHGHSDAWNADRLRSGNMVWREDDRAECDGDPIKIKTNGLEWTRCGVLATAFKNIGQTSSHCLRETTNVLDAQCLTSHAYSHLQTQGVQHTLEKFRTGEVSAPWFWVQVAFDCTPIQLAFGQLQGIIAPCARYFELRRERGRDVWKRLTLDEYRANFKTFPRSGCVECCGIEGSIHWPVPVKLEGEAGKKFLWGIQKEKLLPKIIGLSNNTASNLFSGIETSEPALSFPILAALVRCMRFVVWAAGSDNASQCNRLKAAALLKLREMVEALRNETPNEKLGRVLALFSICISHVFKGILEKGANANPITTTMYSIGFVCSHTLYYATLARRCDILVEKNLRFWPYKKADAAEVRHSKRVHQATFMRKFRTRGRRVPGTSDTVAEKDEEEVRAWCERFIEFFPMGYRQRGIYPHPCKGPTCVCGGTKKGAIREGSRLMNQAFLKCTPHPASPSKWWTQEENLVFIAAGILIFGFLIDLFTHCFSQTEELPEAENDEDDDPITQMRRFACRQIVKGRDSLESIPWQCDLIALMLVSEPLDDSDKTVQHMDERGGALLNLTSPDGMLSTLQGDLAAMLCDPEDSDSDGNEEVEGDFASASDRKKMVLRHFGDDNADMRKKLRETTVSVSAQTWYKGELQFEELPLKLGRLKAPDATVEEKDEIFGDVYRCEGCQDAEWTGEIVKEVPTKAALKADQDFDSLMDAFVANYRAADMHMERVLAKARQATVYSKRKPTLERKCAASHLSFIALEREKLGHLDFRNPQLVVDSSSVVTKHKEDAEARRLQQQRAETNQNGWKLYCEEKRPEFIRTRTLLGLPADMKLFHGTARSGWNGLSGWQRAEYGDRAKAANEEARARHALQEEDDLPREFADLPFCIGHGSRWGLTEEELVQVLPEGQRSGEGLRNKARGLRWEKKESVFVMDRNDIPHEQDFRIASTCAREHLGLCITLDREIFGDALKLGNRLKTFMKSSMTGGHFELTSNREGQYFEEYMPTKIFVAAAWIQGNPKIPLFQILAKQTVTHLGNAVSALVPVWRPPRKYSRRQNRKRILVLAAHGVAKLCFEGTRGRRTAENHLDVLIRRLDTVEMPIEMRRRCGVGTVQLLETDDDLGAEGTVLWRRRKSGRQAAATPLEKPVDDDVLKAGWEAMMAVGASARPASGKTGKKGAPKEGKVKCEGPAARFGLTFSSFGCAPSKPRARKATCSDGAAVGKPGKSKQGGGKTGPKKHAATGEKEEEGHEGEDEEESEDEDEGSDERESDDEDESGSEGGGCGGDGGWSDVKLMCKGQGPSSGGEEDSEEEEEEEEEEPAGLKKTSGEKRRRRKANERSVDDQPAKKKRRTKTEIETERLRKEEEKQRAAAEKHKKWLDDVARSVVGRHKAKEVTTCWDLARTNLEAVCSGCSQKIRPMGFRLRYTPDPNKTFGTGKWLCYHHLVGECVAQGGCELYTGAKDALPRYVSDLPRRFGETDQQKEAATEEALRLAADAFAAAARIRASSSSSSVS